MLSNMTIAEQHDEIGALKAENDKLRDKLAKWEQLTDGIDLPEYPVTQFVPKDLERENAKLRELVRDLWNGMYCPTEPTEGCPSCAFNVDDECAFETRIRKLGIKWVEV